MLKPLDWAMSLYCSFHVYRNAQRLLFLQDKIQARLAGDQQGISRDKIATCASWCNVVREFFAVDYLYSDVWPLARSRILLQRSTALVEIGEHLLYGDSEPIPAGA